MTKNIIFKGRMGELFGEVHRLNVKTIQEAVHAIDTMQGGLKRYLVDCTENGVDFTVEAISLSEFTVQICFCHLPTLVLPLALCPKIELIIFSKILLLQN